MAEDMKLVDGKKYRFWFRPKKLSQILFPEFDIKIKEIKNIEIDGHIYFQFDIEVGNKKPKGNHKIISCQLKYGEDDNLHVSRFTEKLPDEELPESVLTDWW